MEVREAIDGDEIRLGLVPVASADYQAKVMRMGPRYTLSCISGERVNGHRPSADILFSLMVALVRCRIVGITMTEMGRDEASGLLGMRKIGAYTTGQDKGSCAVYGMPMVAYGIGAVTAQASRDNIASVLMNRLNNC